MVEHQGTGPDRARWVCETLARDIGGRAVDGFEEGGVRSFRVQVGRGSDPDGPGDGGRDLREQVSEETLASGTKTRDLGGTASTDEMADAVTQRLGKSA